MNSTTVNEDRPMTALEAQQLETVLRCYPRLTRLQKVEFNWFFFSCVLKAFFNNPSRELLQAVWDVFRAMIMPDLVLFGLPILFVVVWFWTLARIF
jgi:hypothetical protein